jgi:thiamine-phosphate pyrophosphorylase
MAKGLLIIIQGMLMHNKLQGLYAITDASLTPDETLIDQVTRAYKTGVKIVQFRDKTREDHEVEPLCKLLLEVAKTYNALFIIDDRAHLVQKIGAHGLHIGKDDMPLAQAREIVGKECIIGVSCYGSIKKAKEVQREGADYVAFGSFFTSKTKPQSGIVNHSVLAKAKEQLSIPLCAIGGINEENIHLINQFQPDMISTVHAIFKDDAIEENIQNLHNSMQKAYSNG